MLKPACLTFAVIAALTAMPFYARADEEADAYQTQVPPGMELQKAGNKEAYKVVLPKGSAIRREGDLRIIEGTGEYASRKFLELDAVLKKMAADIAALRKEVDEIKKSLAEMRKAALVSK